VNPLSVNRESREPRRKLNRAPSPVIARGIPWFSAMVGVILPAIALIASQPILPPVGFMIFVAWLQLRPGIFPLWAGLPLGLFDDLYAGQPLGSGVLLYSFAGIALDAVESRFPWRAFMTDWLVASGLIVAYLFLGLVFANLTGASTPILVIGPQIVLSVFSYPIVGRLVGFLDRVRLKPFVEVR
jgi:rod shape-determining protein MreD